LITRHKTDDDEEEAAIISAAQRTTMAGLSCGGTCMKYTLFVFNFLFFLSGAAILGVGIWLKVDPNINEYLVIITADSNDPLWNAATITLITVGAFIFVVGFLGCCGACKESSCMLCLYIFLLVLVFIAELVAGILAIVFRNQLGQILDDELQAQAAADVEDEYLTPPALTGAWHAMQVELKCCGGVHWTDYRNNTNFDLATRPVPLTCCVLSNDDPSEPIPSDQSQCFADARQNTLTSSDYLHLTGCSESLGDWFNDKAVILIGVGIGICVLQIIGIIFACCVRKEINDDSKYV